MAPTKRYSGIAPQIDYMGIGRDAIVADPEDVADGSAARAVTGAYLSDRYPNLETSQYDTPEKFMSNYYESLQQKKAAADTAFNQLTLEGGKEEDKIGQYVAQAILAFTPIAAGYMLGGNELGAYGAGAGVIAQRRMISDQEAEALKEEKKTEAKKAFYAKESQEIGKEMTDFYKKQMDRKASLEDKIAYKEELKKRGLDSKGISINTDFERAAAKQAATAVATQFVTESQAIENAALSAKEVKESIRAYLNKNPEAAQEGVSDALIRNISQAISPTDPERQAIAVSTALQRLKTASALIKGAASDADQANVDKAIANNWNVPLSTLMQTMDIIERASVAQFDSARSRAKRLTSEDPFAPSEIIEQARASSMKPILESEYQQMPFQQKKAFLKSGGRFISGK